MPVRDYITGQQRHWRVVLLRLYRPAAASVPNSLIHSGDYGECCHMSWVMCSMCRGAPRLTGMFLLLLLQSDNPATHQNWTDHGARHHPDCPTAELIVDAQCDHPWAALNAISAQHPECQPEWPGQLL